MNKNMVKKVVKNVVIVAGSMGIGFWIGGAVQWEINNRVAVNQQVDLSDTEKRENIVINASALYESSKTMDRWLEMRYQNDDVYKSTTKEDIFEAQDIVAGIRKMCVSIAREVSKEDSISDDKYNSITGFIEYMYSMPYTYLIETVGMESENWPELTEENMEFIGGEISRDIYEIKYMNYKETEDYLNKLHAKRRENKQIEVQQSNFKR